MKFSYSFPLDATADVAWSKLQDPHVLIRCLPGVEEVLPEEDGRYTVVLVTGFGPVKLRFQGKARLEFDDQARRMQADVTMNDSRSGAVYGQFVLEILPNADTSQLSLSSDVAIGGKLGEFAQPLLKRKADQVVKEYAAALAKIVT